MDGLERGIHLAANLSHVKSGLICFTLCPLNMGGRERLHSLPGPFFFWVTALADGGVGEASSIGFSFSFTASGSLWP
jgi:hypothetical protein